MFNSSISSDATIMNNELGRFAIEFDCLCHTHITTTLDKNARTLNMPTSLTVHAAWILVILLTACLSACKPKVKGDAIDEYRKSETTTFRWDFSEIGREFDFAYQQKLTSPSSGNPERTVDARLVIKSNGDGTANVVLKDGIAQSGPNQQIELPPSVLPAMKEDGTAQDAGASEDAMVRLLFPLPRIALAPGKSVQEEIRFPAQVQGVQAYIPIQQTITLNRYEIENERRIAVFEMTFVGGEMIADRKIPDGFAVSIEGSGSFLFDPEKNLYLGGNLKARINKMRTSITLTPVRTK